MTAAERRLLLALFRWARAAGARNIGPRGSHLWKGRDASDMSVVGWGREWPEEIDVAKGGDPIRTHHADSVAEAVDILAALDVIPKRFSTAYLAGWEAGREDIEYPGPAGEAFRAILPAAYLT